MVPLQGRILGEYLRRALSLLRLQNNKRNA